MVVTNIFFQYLSQTTRKSFENIERLEWNFLQFFFVTLSDYADRIIIISIMIFYTLASLVLKRHFFSSGFHRIIELKTSKYEFTDIIHQNKKGFDGKKLSEGQAGRNSLCFNNMCCRLRRIGDRHARFKLFSYLDFRVCFACYPPESFKIICLTCIWLKFVDTSFHYCQKQPQVFLNIVAWSSKLPGGWN